MLRLSAVPTVALLAVVLAGCSSSEDGDPAGAVGGDDTPDLATGKGAIAGLLVDDRYRPLRLTDTPQGEFDAKGFILLVETGATATSDASGEFQFLDLAPGLYTLKPAVSGHEGAPYKVQVDAGSFAEADLVVRRLIDPGKEFVIIDDDTVVDMCQFQFADGRYSPGAICTGDFSDEGNTNFVDYNYTGFPPVVAVVVEAKFDRVDDYELWFTRQENLISELYSRPVAYDSDYYREQILPGGMGRQGSIPFDPSDLRVWLFPAGPGQQEVDETTGICGCGAGFTLIVQARFVVSAFLEMPADLDNYAVLA